MNFRQWWLLARLGSAALRAGLHHQIDSQKLETARAEFCLKVLKKIWGGKDPGRGKRLRQQLENLGTTYIKFGQFLSTRGDLLPADILSELSFLQDRVTPMVGLDAKLEIERSLGQPLDENFCSIDDEPLATASIAQIYKATLLDGTEVIIKLVRPNVVKKIRREMKDLGEITKYLCKRHQLAERLKLSQIVRDQELIMLQETDMLSESQNQINLRANFPNSNLLKVPRVYTKFTRPNLIVMSYADGIPIGDIEKLRERGVDFKVLAEKGVNTFFKQVFEDNFFHADMHSGNILVDIADPKDPRYIALDCAIMGSLSDDDRRYLAQNILAFFKRDYRRIAELHLDSGWIPPQTDVDALTKVIEELCEPIYQKPLEEISFANFLTDLFSAANAFSIEIQPQLALLQKTLLYVEGLGRRLYPQLNLWETAMPFMTAWAERNLGPTAVLGDYFKMAEEFFSDPFRLRNFIHQTPRQRIKASLQAKELLDLNRETRRSSIKQKRMMFYGLLVMIVAITVLKI